MKIIKPYTEILTPFTRESIMPTLKLIEAAARTCYKSEDAITEDSAGPFVQKIACVYKHESVIEHSSVTVRFVVDRGVSHELVRHRLAAYSQESTRYANYSKDKFGSEITVVRPAFFAEGSDAYRLWYNSCTTAEQAYLGLLALGRKPQEARSVLPNSLKTEVVMTANLREWRHVFRLRCAPNAHPQMREVMIPLANQFAEVIPELFDPVEE